MKKNTHIPDFLIVGAMKAGTTTLMKYLVENPAIAIPDQEVHYFSNDANYKKGIEWYKKHFEINSRTKIIGEKTPAYSLHSKVPKRIYDLNPNMKLVWVLRNPVSRTYSNYLHAVRKGAEKNSFEEALKKEDDNKSQNYVHDYKRRSRYCEQINWYLRYFPIRKMHFIIFEHFINNPQHELKKLFDFLNIDNIKHVDEPRNIKANKSYLPYSITLQYYSRKLLGDTFLYRIINRINCFIPIEKPPMQNDTKKKLYDYFSLQIYELSKLINKDLTIWNIDNSR